MPLVPNNAMIADPKEFAAIPKGVLPDDVDISFAFDESPTVRTAISNVGTEGAIGAALT